MARGHSRRGRRGIITLAYGAVMATMWSTGRATGYASELSNGAGRAAG
jgi:hypothetical protein